jgi:hypothetical protein
MYRRPESAIRMPPANDSDRFDPYYRWLAIPHKDQPANHYRLLGLELFEADTDVIRDAGARQTAHVRTYQLGQHSELSQEILNEIAAALSCLRDEKRKAAYDNFLRQELQKKSEGEQRRNLSNSASTAKRSGLHPGILIGSAVAGLLVVGSALWLYSAGRGNPSADQIARIEESRPLEPSEPMPTNPAKSSQPTVVAPGNKVPVPTGWVRIVNCMSGRALGVKASSRATGADVIQGNIPPSQTDAHWTLDSSGYSSPSCYRIRNRNSNQFLAIEKRSRESGARVCQLPATGRPAIVWKLEPLSDGFWKIVNRNSDLCLGIPRGQDRDYVGQVPINDDTAPGQEWRFEAVGSP